MTGNIAKENETMWGTYADKSYAGDLAKQVNASESSPHVNY